MLGGGGGVNGQLTAKELRGLKFGSFITIVFATIAIIGMIIALVLLGLATDTVNNLKINDGCNDYNDCTYDYEKDSGGCINLPKKQDDSCRSECYDAEATDQTCSSLQITPGVLTPVCTSPSQQFCKGFCLTDGDCPALSTIAGDVAGECFATTCYYRIDPTGGATIDGNEVPELICNQDYQVYQTTCESYLNTSDTLVKSRCIISDVQCETVPTNLGSAPAAICYYYHACSVQQYIPVMIMKRSLSQKRKEFSGMIKTVTAKNGRVVTSDNSDPAPAASEKKERASPNFNLIGHKYDPKNKRVEKPFQPPVVIPEKEENEASTAKQPSTVPRSKLGIRY